MLSHILHDILHFLPRTHMGVETFFDPSKWLTTTSPANSFHSSTLRLDMHYGSRMQGNQICPYKSVMSVSYAEPNSTVSSTLCFRQTIHPTCSVCQNIMDPLSPVCWIISIMVLSV